MQQLRADARRARSGSGEPGSSSAPAQRARAGLPLLLAPVTITLAAVGAALAGLPLPVVLLVTLVVAVTGAAIAHRTVASLLSGLVLLLARPFGPGDRLRLYVPELRRVAEAEVLRVGLLTTTLCTESGVLVVPNAALLRVPPDTG